MVPFLARCSLFEGMLDFSKGVESRCGRYCWCILLVLEGTAEVLKTYWRGIAKVLQMYCKGYVFTKELGTSAACEFVTRYLFFLK